MDFGELFGQAGDAIQDALKPYTDAGGTGLKATIENAALDLLKKETDKTNKQLATNIKAVQNLPASPPGSFGAFFASTFQNAFVSANTPYVLAGLGIACVVGYLILKKR